MTFRVDNVVTSGLFKLDGGEWEVDNNVWIVGDDSEVYIIDAAHDAKAIAAAAGNRRVKGIIATHGHSDHIDAAPELSRLVNAPVYLHPTDEKESQQQNLLLLRGNAKGYNLSKVEVVEVL